MATAQQQKKLRGLFEQSMKAGGLKEFRKNWEESIGLRHREKQTLTPEGEISGTRHEQVYDPAADAFRDDHRATHEGDASGNWAIGEVFNSLCGPRWKDTFEQQWQRAANMRFEGFGGDVMAGDTPYVSAAIDVVAGLMNARALARAKDPEWIWDKMVNVEEATGEGGFHIGNRLDPSNFDGSGTDLADGQSPPTAKTVGTRIHRNRTLRQARRVKVNFWAMRDDLTSQIMETVDQSAVIVIAERERKVADAVMGVATGTTLGSGASIGVNGTAMPMVQDALAFFPYQKGSYGSNAGANTPAPENGAYVANFGNANETDGLGLTNYTTLQTATQVLNANLDPFTGLPTPVSLKGMQFLIAPAAAIQLKFLLESTALWQIAWGNATPASISTANVSTANLVKDLGLEIIESQFWFNRLVKAGVYKVAADGTVTHQNLTNTAGDTYSTAGSIMSAYFMGKFRESVHYWQRMPYATQQIPLGSVEMGEQTVMVQDHHERGQAFWVSPRSAWRAWA